MSITPKHLREIITVTFTPQGNFNRETLRAHISFLIEREAAGLVPLGGPGKHPAPSLQEHDDRVAA